ncbi:putative non-ribosomal peptide synthetase [Gordonia polyisoprenivorans VH2]|uniref:Putative non-ribosomal peptide synthetase n=1 Tax=Gordonia polyisoprenivorans (strain DSM 44266 / VH2) TaxID=1112204 RepID=H6N1T2_GORPV|nr:non-ribosomal peptide synthetase [Gordonia polyisoprenivorans]AFA74602.1 putative non-ribosomal peptide synthetase [Gordonia polyisoprenivorans VH2]
MTEVVRMSAASPGVAVVCGDRRVTYAEFAARVNDLARWLIATGVGPDVAVGVAMPRSVEMLVAIHAIVEAGGHYVPLDVDAPLDRVRYMLDTADARIVLVVDGAAPAVIADLPEPIRVIGVDTSVPIDPATPPIADAERRAPIRPDDAAYTLFTSGSTGRPKGVTVSHSAIVNRLEWMREWYGFKDSDVVLQKTPITFDVSVWELFLPATVGATLVLAEPDRHGDPDHIADLITTENVTVIHFVPSMLATFVDVLGPRLSGLRSLRAMFTSGEALAAATAQAVLAELPALELHNLYGPTEAAVDVTAHHVLPGEATVPIGVPVPSTTTFVLDARLQLVPVGVPGELYLGGIQIARGYASASALTAERFVADPFGPPGARLYRTGDLVRWNSAGEIEYLGRTDFQVKLRGQRMELGEVEAVLASAPGVVHAAAAVVDFPAGAQLVGYVSPDDVDLDAVRATVTRALPEYMRPTLWVPMAVMPRNSAGKVARRALPRPEIEVREIVAPETGPETEIAAIYADVLGLDRVSVTESFFDLGGNSLAATRVAARVAQTLDADVTVRDLFDTPTVRGLANALTGRGRTRAQLTARPRPQRLPLSTAQSRMWFINQFDTDSSAYNIPMGLRVEGAVDTDALRLAVLDVLARHEVLRTVYPSDGAGPYQRILETDAAAEELDFAVTDDEAELAASAVRGFDVSSRLPIRVRVRTDRGGGRAAEDRAAHSDVVITVHHIAFDGESSPVFVGDLLNAYLRRTGAGIDAPLPLPVQYADFALWQREVVGDVADPGSPAAAAMAYWRAHLAGLPAVTDLPMDRPRPAVLDTTAAVVSVEVDDAVAAKFEAFAREHDVTAFMLSHAALAITVARLAATSDVVIGAPIAGRTDAALADLVGMFVNTLVLRTDVDPAVPIGDFVAAVRSTDVEAFAHADVQFDDLIDELAPERSTAYPPLVQIAFTHESAGAPADAEAEVQVAGLAARPLGPLNAVAKFDLTVGVADRSADRPMRADFLYATSLFDEDTVVRFAQTWLQVVTTMVADPRRAVGDIDVVDDAALSAMRPSRNSTGVLEPAADGGISTPRPLVDILDARVLDPAGDAVICDGEVLSHSEFDERTHRLARELTARGVRPDDVVAVGLERSVDSVVAVFGVIRSGAAYVPIDPAYPQDRIDYMIADSGVRLGVTNAATRHRLGAAGGCDWIDVAIATDPARPAAPVTAADRAGEIGPDTLAYLVYTSGSTGRPKAVGVGNRGIATLVDALREITGTPEQAPDTRVLHVASPSFDASVLEMMWSVALGHTLVVAPPTAYAGEALGAVLSRDRVTDTLITPTVLATVPVERGRTIRNLVTGGEACPPELVARWANGRGADGRGADGRRMYNFYGPSEATVWSSTGRSEVGRPVTIGHPVRGFTAYVLDARLHPVPRGVVGELYLGTSDSLARGYLGRPGLTATSFVADPFTGIPGQRMYATGDLVRLRRDGQIEFAGRADHQVKINGQRIELGEIESVLTDLPEVASAVVLGVADDSGRSRLVAYLVPDDGATIDPARIVTAAGARLAGHMIPHQVVVLAELPLTPGGKLDRAALPAPEPVFEAADRVSPATAAETALAAIVAGLLGRDEVGVTESFFALGGDSIMSIQLASAAKAAGLTLTPRDIFEHKTVRAMARAATDGATALPVLADPPGGPTGPTELGAIISWMVDTSPAPEDFADFNQSMVLAAPRELSVDDLAIMLAAVCAAHPMLTARLTRGAVGWALTTGEPFDAHAAIERVITDSASGTEDFDESVRDAHARAAALLDPAAGQVMRAALVVGADVARLVLVIHHLAVDAVSWPILIEDLLTAAAAVSAGTPPVVRSEPTSMRAWQQALADRRESRESELALWLSRSPETPTRLGVDPDPQRDRLRTVGSVIARIDAPITGSLLAAVPEAFGGSVNDVLAGTLSRAIRSWQQQRGIADDRAVTILVEGHGRHEDILESGPDPRRADLSRTVGWFTTLIPMLVDPGADAVHAVKSAKEQRLTIPDHGIGFADLRAVANSPLAQRPLPTIALNYLGNRAATDSGGDVGEGGATAHFLPAPDAPFLPSSVSGAMPVMAPLTINAAVTTGANGPVLAADLRFAQGVLSEADATDIAERWRRELAELTEIVDAGEPVGLSPSDVPGSHATQDDLDEVAARYPGAAIWPLSPLQRGLYFQSVLAGNGPATATSGGTADTADDVVDAYVTQAVLRLGGDVDLDRLRAAADELLLRHRVLASGFVRARSGAVLAVIPPDARAGWRVVDLADDAAAPDRVAEIARQERNEPFDLASPPLLRVVVIGHGDQTDVVITNHHILFDGWSGPLVLADLMALYATGSAYTGDGSGGDFRDFLHHIGRIDDRAGLQAWARRLARAQGPTLVAPGAEATAEHRPAEHIVAVPAELTAALEDSVRRHGTTLATVLQVAWALLVARLSESRVVTFGETVSGRPADLPGVENMVGLFINTLPVVVDVDPDATLAAVASALQDDKTAVLDHQHLGLPEIIAHSGVPIAFDTLTVHESYPVDTASLSSASPTAVGGLQVRGVDVSDSTHYPLNLATSVRGDRLHLRFAYLPTAFDEAQIMVFATALTRILQTFVDAPDTPIGEVPLVDSATAALLDDWSHGAVVPLEGDAVTDLLARRAADTPDAIAVIADEREVTYAELLTRASTLARELIASGVGPDTAVAVCIPRSVEMIVAIHAVWAAGAQFVPIDTGAPEDRVRYMTEVADVSLVLVGPGPIPDGIAALHDVRTLTVDAATAVDLSVVDSTAVAPVTADDRRANVLPEHAAYTIFTSGSTGRPKGVTVSRRALSTHLAFDRDYYGFGPDDVVLQQLEYTFDPAIIEIVRPVVCGGRLVLLHPGEHRDPVLVTRRMIDHGVTSATLVPSVLGAMAEIVDESDLAELTALRLLHTGGEALTRPVADAIGRLLPATELYNQYGPTETTIYAAVQHIRRDGHTVPIGRPLWNTVALVLDERLRPVPPGLPGELYFGGDLVARGYAGQPTLTAERFVADPYGPAGARLYRTGDLVRWNAEGELEYLGRTDFQTKLRGQRIELGEIEAVLTSAPGVVHAAATVVATPAGESLVGYLAPDTVDLDAVKATVTRALPEFMRPAIWVLLEQMPLNTAGKISRRELPAPQQVSGEIVAPSTPAEQVLAEVFAGVLGVEQVSVIASFFDAGGNSLSAMRVAARAGEALGREISVRDVFEAPSVRELAALAGGRGASGPAMVPPAPRPDRVPLSLAQQRMWFINRFDPTSPAYNVPAALALHGALDVEALHAAVLDVVARHEILRTTFPENAGVPEQLVHPVSAPVDWQIAGSRDDLEAAATTGFDVTVDFPLRARLWSASPEEHVFVLVLHHIAADGESLAPLVADLVTAYHARVAGVPPQFEPLALQFADVAVWQHRHLGSVDEPGSILHAQWDYWSHQLAGLPSVLDLPTDRPRPVVASTRGATTHFEIDAPIAERITALAQEYRVTPFMVIHAGLSVLLARLSASDDIAVGTPVAGRGRPELDPLIGMFVNTLVLRSDYRAQESFHGLLERIRGIDLDAYAHADIPFETLVDHLNPVRSEAFAPLTQVLLTLEQSVIAELAGESVAGGEVAGLQVRPLSIGEIPAKVDLLFSVTPAAAGHSWSGAVQYATDLFDAHRVESMAASLVGLLDRLTAEPGTAVGDAPLLRAEQIDELVPVSGGPEVAPMVLADIFAAAVAGQRRRTAVIDPFGAALSYRDVDARSNRLARWLIGRGIGAESLVALAIPRSADLFVAIWAVAKTGGGYVPIDPGYPAERVSAMIEDSGAVLGLSIASVGDLPGDDFEWVATDHESTAAEIAAMDDAPIGAEDRLRVVRPDNVAYVIYTSGSTGRPKGVAVSHTGLWNFARAESARLGVGDGPIVMGYASPSFDASVLEYLLAVANNGTLVYRPADAVGGEALQEFMIDREVTHTFLTPTTLSTLDPARLPAVECIAVGGEAVPQALQDHWSAHVRIQNAYGPTETTILTNIGEIATPGTPVRIGAPLHGLQQVVLDARLHPVPEGVVGDFYIAGCALSRGYLDRPGLTAERFVAAPFGAPGTRMYRTGDLARRRRGPDGRQVIEYAGRSDDQVKLRGLRIELGEIEAELGRHRLVDAAVVIGVGADGVGAEGVGGSVASALAAYVVPTDPDADQATLIADLRAHLTRRLPAHMVPASITVLAHLPLTPVGKLDKRALPAPQIVEREIEPLRNDVERAVAAAYVEVLDVDEVGADDSFFDLGGNSLSAARVAAYLRGEHQLEIELAWLFSDATVRGLAQRITGADAATADVLITLRAEGSRPPLFCVHPAGGLAWFYGGLVPYLADRPIYGLQDPHVVGGEPSITDAHALAQRYVAQIREVAPHGPYRILGWSVGGVIAHAMATRLQSEGETVDFLGVMDSVPEDPGATEQTVEPAPDATARPGAEQDGSVVVDVLGGWRDLFDLGDDVQASTPEEVTAIIRAQIEGMGLLGANQVDRIMTSFELSPQVVLDFVPAVFRGDLQVFTATEDKDDPSTIAEGWRACVSGEIRNVDVATHHLGMADAASLAVIGPVLDAELAALDSLSEEGRRPGRG